MFIIVPVSYRLPLIFSPLNFRNRHQATKPIVVPVHRVRFLTHPSFGREPKRQKPGPERHDALTRTVGSL